MFTFTEEKAHHGRLSILFLEQTLIFSHSQKEKLTMAGSKTLEPAPSLLNPNSVLTPLPLPQPDRWESPLIRHFGGHSQQLQCRLEEREGVSTEGGEGLVVFLSSQTGGEGRNA